MPYIINEKSFYSLQEVKQYMIENKIKQAVISRNGVSLTARLMRDGSFRKVMM